MCGFTNGKTEVTSPLNRYIDILGMRAFKCQLGCRVSYPHLLSQRDLDEAIARTNYRMAAESFGLHIFRTISKILGGNFILTWLRQLPIQRPTT